MNMIQRLLIPSVMTYGSNSSNSLASSADCATPPPSSVGNYSFYQGITVGNSIISCSTIGTTCDTTWLSLVSLCERTDGCVSVNLFYSNNSYHSCLTSANGSLATANGSSISQQFSSTGISTMDKPGLGAFTLPGYAPLPRPTSGDLNLTFSEFHPMYLGCYNHPSDDNYRLSSPFPFILIFDHSYNTSEPIMSVSICAKLAGWAGLAYFGLQADGQCFGGVDIDRATMYGRLNGTSDCNVVCPGNVSELCGGLYQNSLYTLGGTGAWCGG